MVPIVALRAVIVIVSFAWLFLIVHVTMWSPLAHTVCPVTVAVCADAGSAVPIRTAATIAI